MKFSQNDEEEIILKYFGDFVGTFADIGSNDGITLSNTRALVERGWKGILVDPAPAVWNDLKDSIKDFPNVYAYPFAITDKNGEMTLNESGALLGKEDHSLVSTFKADEMDRFKSVVTYTPVKVKTFRWKTFLNRVKYKKFDFISIDCEGYDAEVLSQIDLSNVRMICVEWNGKNKLTFTELCAGFTLIAENGENLIFAR